MKKRRITLNLDDDVVEALEAMDSPSLSAAANHALREALATEAHRAALTRWLEELDAVHGCVTPQEAADIDALVDELASRSSATGAA